MQSELAAAAAAAATAEEEKKSGSQTDGTSQFVGPAPLRLPFSLSFASLGEWEFGLLGSGSSQSAIVRQEQQRP